MSTELSIKNLGIEVVEDKTLDNLAKSADYLPQLRVYGSESTVVKEGKFPMGHLGLYFTADKVVDLDTEQDVLVINARPRASIISGDSTPINFYGKLQEDNTWDTNDPNFTEIKDRALAKVKSHMVGVEYLLYIPSIREFCLFFMGSPTLRRESANLKALMLEAATIKIKLIKNSEYTWHGCTIFKCSTPFEIPEAPLILEQVEKFKKPVDSNITMGATETRDR
jgi:hypothetical protein